MNGEYLLFLLAGLQILGPCYGLKEWTREEMDEQKEIVKDMFYFAYNNYIDLAYPFDELRPISGDGRDSYGGMGITLVDALDTLAILGDTPEFARVVALIEKNLNVEADVNVSLFETNIRVLGGLISGHLMYKQVGVKLPENWPCDGPLLRKAVKLADRLLPAFDTPTGMPFGSLNLKNGVSPKETPVTCTACVGTYYLEFAALSRLTGKPIYEQVALKALESLFASRSAMDLVGNHINVSSSNWVYTDSTIGSGVDSYFEYLLKGSFLTGYPDLYEMFKVYYASINKHMRRDDWHLWVALNTGQAVFPYFNSLEAFWPGLLTLYGDIDMAKRTFSNYYSIWEVYGFLPEFMNIHKYDVVPGKEGYPLRPELIESAYYLFQATKDPYYLSAGRQFIESLEHSARVDFGYAHVNRVTDHALEDQMESFFLSETIKYLYLLFDVDNFINAEGEKANRVTLKDGTDCFVNVGGYIFNTEAHPIDPSALYCCHNAANDLEIIKHRTRDFEKSLFNHPDSKSRTSKSKSNESFSFLKTSPKNASSNIGARDQCSASLQQYLLETSLSDSPLDNYAITPLIQSCSPRCEINKFLSNGLLASKDYCL